MSVLSSVCPHVTSRLPVDRFSWNLIFNLFSKIYRKNQVLLKFENNNRHFTWSCTYTVFISCGILFWVRSVSDEWCRKNQNTHFIFRKFSRKSCRLWDNVEKYGRARPATGNNIIRRMRFAYKITKAANTHSECVLLFYFPRRQWLRKSSSVLHCAYMACLVFVMPRCRKYAFIIVSPLTIHVTGVNYVVET
jgi:hypothetical protein